MSQINMEPVEVARDYYNSEDADAFYSTIWGGEDIHIGLYHSEDDRVHEASRRTQERMAEKLSKIGSDHSIIDLGSGYGGAARFLSRRYGCKVVALNLSEVENERARKLNRDQGLDDLIDVVDGHFEELPYADAAFDVVWSQDAFLHSPDRKQVISEAARVLKPEGELIFTDPMQADDCPDGVLQPILDRIHLESVASPKFYRDTALHYGFKEIHFEELTEHLRRHYSAILNETETSEQKLRKHINDEYLQNMKKGLKHWIKGADNGYLAWGIFHFGKQ